MDARNEDGTFKLGHSGFKPKGSTNEFQKVTREKMGEFLKVRLEDLESIYKELSAREKAKLILSIAEFFLPKQKEFYIDSDTQSRSFIDYSKLKPSTLKEILDATITENQDR